MHPHRRRQIQQKHTQDLRRHLHSHAVNNSSRDINESPKHRATCFFLALGFSLRTKNRFRPRPVQPPPKWALIERLKSSTAVTALQATTHATRGTTHVQKKMYTHLIPARMPLWSGYSVRGMMHVKKKSTRTSFRRGYHCGRAARARRRP